MMRVHLGVHWPTVLLGLGFALCGMQAARSDDLRVGLIIANEDYERLPESGEAFIYVALSRLKLKRLARS